LEFKLKKNIGEGMKMFRKYQLAVWLSIQNFYSHFTKVTRKCESFGRIVELWYEERKNICMFFVRNLQYRKGTQCALLLVKQSDSFFSLSIMQNISSYA